MSAFSERQLFGKVNYSLEKTLPCTSVFQIKYLKTNIIYACGQRSQYFPKSQEFVLELWLKFYAEVGEFQQCWVGTCVLCSHLTESAFGVK